jgi:hypothetical protein
MAKLLRLIMKESINDSDFIIYVKTDRGPLYVIDNDTTDYDKSRAIKFPTEQEAREYADEFAKNTGNEGKEDKFIVARLNEDTILGTETSDEKKAKADAKAKGLYTEDVDEDETVDEVVDDIQDETPTEDEEENSTLDKQLDELRDILPDLDLNLYQVTSKENPNSSFYFIGKVADDSNKVLMLVDNKPVENDDENLPIEVEEDDDSNIEPVDGDETSEDEEEDNRFDFVIVPDKFDDFTKLNPRYGDELNPDHDAVMDYLMKCLVEVNPEKAQELNQDDAEDINTEVNIDIPENLEDEDKI